MWLWQVCLMSSASRRHPWSGCRATEARPRCSISSPAASTSWSASHPEGQWLIDAGKVKSLAVLDENRSTLYPTVPTIKEAIGSTWTMGAWRGIAAPECLPPAIQTRLAAAVKKASTTQSTGTS